MLRLCDIYCRGQPKLLHQLLHSARMAKVQLSTLTETVVHMPSSSNPRAQRGPTLNISRIEMEGMTQRLRSKLSPPLERLGKECYVDWVGECVSQSGSIADILRAAKVSHYLGHSNTFLWQAICNQAVGNYR